MKTRTMVVAIAVSTGLFATGALAQHEEHHDQAAPPADKADTGKTGGMMSGNMMSQMPQMMITGQNETGKLVDQLMKSFTALQVENDPVALKQKLARHGTLLKELQTKVHTQSYMMDMMQQKMSGTTMGGTAMGSDNKK